MTSEIFQMRIRADFMKTYGGRNEDRGTERSDLTTTIISPKRLYLLLLTLERFKFLF